MMKDSADTADRDVIDLNAPMESPAEAGAPAPEETAGSAIPEGELARITDDVITELKSVYDPEIPVDI
jgi:hypothetical protein